MAVAVAVAALAVVSLLKRLLKLALVVAVLGAAAVIALSLLEQG
ncbi:MAG: hypothetical protein ACKVWR_22315 [Acidimicrobiales bacterium]